MSNSMVKRNILKRYILALFIIGFFVIGDTVAEEELVGAEEYRISCITCHGEGGKGNGPLVKFLTVKPTDLTQLANENGGQYPNLKAGRYPFFKVYQIIDGRTVVAGHGDRAMPVWGDRYLSETSEKYGPYLFGGHEKIVRGRILELVYYIQSIQE